MAVKVITYQSIEMMDSISLLANACNWEWNIAIYRRFFSLTRRENRFVIKCFTIPAHGVDICRLKKLSKLLPAIALRTEIFDWNVASIFWGFSTVAQWPHFVAINFNSSRFALHDIMIHLLISISRSKNRVNIVSIAININIFSEKVLHLAPMFLHKLRQSKLVSEYYWGEIYDVSFS